MFLKDGEGGSESESKNMSMSMSMSMSAFSENNVQSATNCAFSLRQGEREKFAKERKKKKLPTHTRPSCCYIVRTIRP